MIYTDLINNVKFEAYYDKSQRALHVLDAMGMSLEPRMSLTNGIDNLIPILEKHFKIKYEYKLYLYGTDGIISEYNPITNRFIHVSKDNPSVFYEFKDKMEILYQKENHRGNTTWL